MASYHGHVECVQWLLEFGGVECALKTKLGWLALHSAAKIGNVDICRVLVSYGYDINAITNNETPLCFAFRAKNMDCIRWLINHGADITLVHRVAIPAWVHAYIASREACRRASITFMGLLRKRSFGYNNKDVFGIIGKMVWATRENQKW